MADVAALTPADRAAAVALWTAAGLTRPWNDPDRDFELAATGKASVVLGLRDGDLLVGTVMVGWDGHSGWLYYLAVADDRRGRGVGRALVQAAETWLRGHHAPKVQLMVRTDTAAAAGFYRALGYEPQEVVVMGRRLNRGEGDGADQQGR